MLFGSVMGIAQTPDLTPARVDETLHSRASI